MPLMAEKTHVAEKIRVEDYIGLLSSCVLRFVKNGPVQDSELYSVGCIALMEAAETFDPSKAKFCTWATRLINQRILDEIKRNKRVKESSCAEIESFPEEFDEVAPTHIIPKLLEGEEEDGLILVGRYMEGKSLSELGKEFGFSKEWMRKRINHAVSRIRRKNRSLLESHR